ncbi:MAG: hypothetical protein K8R99_14545 [Actinomycetia bacterium]|nr:hypothetical protein [Actinomycetes bacterium]
MKIFGLVVAGLLATGCTPTTYDASNETSAPTAPTTTTAISDDPVAVLPLMLVEVTDLARRVSEGDGETAAATRIEDMWAAIKESVRDAQPDLYSGFEFVVRRCRDAAEFNRPADADRALKNLEALVEAYLAG